MCKEAQAKEAEAASARRAAEEQGRFFNQQHASADFVYWSKSPYWKLDEAVALSFGKAPEVVNWETVRPFRQISTFAGEYDRRRELALRACHLKQLYDPVLPGVFLAWLKRHELDFPAELEEQVTARGIVVADFQSLYEEQKQRYDDHLESTKKALDDLEQVVAGLLAERDQLWAQIDQLSAAPPPSPGLSTRERDTLLKMSIALAVSAYGHDPRASRSDTVKQIADDLASIGLTLDQGTIRKWLKAASDMVAPETWSARYD